MQATTATCLLGGNGNGPVNVSAYFALLARYSSVTVIFPTLRPRRREGTDSAPPDRNTAPETCETVDAPRTFSPKRTSRRGMGGRSHTLCG